MEANATPLVGRVFSVLLSLASTTVLTLFLAQSILSVKAWRRLPLVAWVVLAIYVDSYLFVFATAILQHSVGVNSSLKTCEGAILLCLVCYVTTKILIYLFLVEKAHFIRGTRKPRMKSKLYIFNCFGMLGIYVVVAILNFVFRIAKLKDGVCIIGMKGLAMIPLISFDTVVNVYLTSMFIIPLRKLHSFKAMPRSPANLRLRRVAFRTFFGASATLISSIVNLTVLMVLNGEPGWVCLICCNADILFSAIVIRWVTSKDNAGTLSSLPKGPGAMAHAAYDTETPCNMQQTRPSTSQDSISDMGEFSATRDSSADVHIKTPAGVVVTTTIRHERGPSVATSRFDDSCREAQAEMYDFLGRERYGGPHISIMGGHSGNIGAPTPPNTYPWGGSHR